jgi:L-fucose mutarotase
MLKNIPGCLSPDLMHALMSMGHGDEIVLADADFPGVSYSQRLIRCDGVPLTTLFEAILPFFPLDPFTEKPTATMEYRPWSSQEPASYERFRQILRTHDPKFVELEYVERFAFYERARKAYAVVMTSEPDGNLILKKGVVNL